MKNILKRIIRLSRLSVSGPGAWAHPGIYGLVLVWQFFAVWIWVRQTRRRNRSNIILDTTSVMQEKTYPRLDFCDADNTALVSIVGMEGTCEFLVPLGELTRRELAEKASSPRSKSELSDDDICLGPFQSACDTGQSVEICMRTNTVRQCWSGVIKGLKPAMGFMNIMTPDFHLHLKGGTVTGWKTEATVQHAIGVNGQRSGLTIKVKT